MIYTATREDLEKVVDMALKIPTELGFDNFPEPSIIKVTNFIYTNWLEYPIFVYKIPSEDAPEELIIVGMIGVKVDNFWWSDKSIITDYMFYIEKDYRTFKTMNQLIGAMADFAKLNNLPAVSNFISKEGTETKLKLFERHGFKQSGFIASLGV